MEGDRKVGDVAREYGVSACIIYQKCVAIMFGMELSVLITLT
jgi:hypothetical protein